MIAIIVLFAMNSSDAISAIIKPDTCGPEQFYITDFSNPQKLLLNGSADYLGKYVEVNQSFFFTAGSIWYPDKVPVQYGFIVRYNFSVTFENQGDAKDNSVPGADGFAFVIQNYADYALGTIGAGIGYEGIPNSLAVEFDTFNDSYPQPSKWNDPNGNHVAVQTKGSNPNSSYHNLLSTLAINPNIPDITKGGTIQIDYNYVPTKFRVLYNNKPVIVLESFDLGKYIKFDKGNAYIGFTGACANASEAHNILSWFFCPIVPVLDIVISSRDNKICEGDTMSLFATSGFDSYKWSTGESGSKIVISTGGKYTVTGTDAKGNTYESPVYNVYVNPLPTPAILGDSIICPGGETTLYIEEDEASYYWSTGDTTKSTKARKSGFYYLTVTDLNGCSNTLVKRVDVSDLLSPELVLIGNNPICYNDSLVLKTLSQYKTYRWSTGETTDSIVVKNSGNFSVEVVDDKGCRGTSKILSVSKLGYEPPAITGDLALCDGSQGILSVVQDFVSYQWSTGDNTKSITINKSGDYRLIATDKNGCTYDTTISVAKKGDISVKITGPNVLCPGESVVLASSSDFDSYVWSTGETSKSITVSSQGMYFLTATDVSGCKGLDSIYVTDLNIALSGLESLIFPDTPVSSTGNLGVNLTNKSNAVVSISSIHLLGKSGNVIRMNGAINYPVIIPENSSFPFNLSFSPPDFKDYSDSLVVVMDQPCQITLTVPVTGRSTASVNFSMPKLTVKISSDTTDIPITMKFNFYSDKSFGYKAKISFDNSVFEPIMLSSGKMDYNGFSKGIGEIVISDTSLGLSNSEVVINKIRGRVLLAEKKFTVLNFDSIYIDRPDITPVSENGSISVYGVCNSTISTIVLFSKVEMSLSPNPANDRLNLFLKNIDGGRIKVTVYSLQGEKISESIFATKNPANKEFTTDINTENLSSGFYFLTIELNGEYIKAPLMIVK